MLRNHCTEESEKGHAVKNILGVAKETILPSLQRIWNIRVQDLANREGETPT